MHTMRTNNILIMPHRCGDMVMGQRHAAECVRLRMIHACTSCKSKRFTHPSLLTWLRMKIPQMKIARKKQNATSPKLSCLSCLLT